MFFNDEDMNHVGSDAAATSDDAAMHTDDAATSDDAAMPHHDEEATEEAAAPAEAGEEAAM